jgi:hypothetical protein
MMGASIIRTMGDIFESLRGGRQDQFQYYRVTPHQGRHVVRRKLLRALRKKVEQGEISKWRPESQSSRPSRPGQMKEACRV